MENKFLVTETAYRPGSPDFKGCIYCQQLLGTPHKDDCVCINKKVKVRFVAEYEINVPKNWNKEDIEFHRNEGSWCIDNALRELEEVAKTKGCLCSDPDSFYFELIEESKEEPFLKE